MMLWLSGFLLSAVWLPWLPQAGSELRWTWLGVAVPLLCITNRALFTATRANLLVLSLLTWMLVSSAWSPHPLPALGAAFHLVILGLSFWLGSTATNPDALYRGMVWGLVPSLLLLPIQLAGWTIVPAWNVPAGLFLNRLFLAELALPLLILAVQSRQWPLVGMAGACLLLTGSKACWLIALCWIIWQSTKPRWALLAAFPLLAAAAWYSPHTIAHRLDIWQWTIEHLTLLGHGLASYPVVYGAEHAHNDALEIAYVAGFPGLALLGCCAWGALRGPASGERYALWAIALVSLVSFPLHNPATAFLACFLAGRCVAAGAGARGGYSTGRMGFRPGTHSAG